jgi:hypothetical protein
MAMVSYRKKDGLRKGKGGIAYGVGKRFLKTLRCLLLDLVGDLGVTARVGDALSLVVLHCKVWIGDCENGGGW